MGVKLGEIILKKELKWEDLKNKKIAIDSSNCLYQFLSSIRQRDGTPLTDSKGRITSHLIGLFSRTANLMQQGAKLCYIFDGKPPLLKVKIQEEREYKKRIAEEKFKEAKEKEDIPEMYRYAKQTSRLTPEIVNESKELLKAMGLPVIQSPAESDAQMAFMNERKDVDFSASSDMDCLLYGTPRLITNLTLSQRRKLPSGSYIKITPELIELKPTLKALKITQDQLIALGILVGSDYNPGGVKGIGPKTALKLVHQYKSFDDLFKEVKADFNWKEIYAVFKSMPIMKNYQLKWTSPNEEAIKKLLIDKHEFSEERVNKALDRLKKSKSKKEQSALDKWTK